jgi:hypothetical protein
VHIASSEFQPRPSLKFQLKPEWNLRPDWNDIQQYISLEIELFSLLLSTI